MSKSEDSSKITTNLTNYASLIGENFASKIHLLTQIIQGAHYPSVGRYKERLLSKTISDFIPRQFEVGSGFVLFPKEKKFGYDLDPLNMADHEISRQCDIIVYDSSSYPVIFKDEDFVVVRPESVKAIIEVKGSLRPNEVKSILENFFDFGTKWKTSQLFYSQHHQPVVQRPTLLAMCWNIATDKKGKPTTDGKKVRKQIAEFYKNKSSTTFDGFPILDSLYIYDECSIDSIIWFDSERPEGIYSAKGWITIDGKFIRYNEKGEPFRGADRTVAALLAKIHYALGSNFNRFFSYVDETKRTNILKYKDFGFDAWLEDTEKIRSANTDKPEKQKS